MEISCFIKDIWREDVKIRGRIGEKGKFVF